MTSFALQLAALASPSLAQVDYAIDLRAPDHHTGTVSIRFPASPGPALDVKMPIWRTGRYQLLPLPNGVRRFAATDEGGRALRWEKVDNATWRIHGAAGRPVRVSYEIYANELGQRTRHIDDSHVYLNPQTVFLYADRFRSEEARVALRLPEGWKAFSGMEQPRPSSFVAANWDVLADSPIEAGPHQLRSFAADGRSYELVIWGRGNHDGDRIAADLKRLVPQTQTMWRGYPYRRYLFIVHATDNVGGATEHLNSTVIQIPRYAFRPEEQYKQFLSTASHELIHTWNVKAYRPAGLVPYDYQRANLSDLLWVAEGSTDYFADHLLLRAGLIQPADYFNGLADSIEASRRRPGRAVQSVAEASFDEWIAPTGHRALNASVNIYSEGVIASWALDIALLQQTAGRVSYRDVHRLLHQRFDSRRVGYTAADIRAILRELTGTSWDDWWARHVERPYVPDFDALLAPVGLRLDPPKERVADAGWSAEASAGAMRLTQVLGDGPAWQAGLEADDMLVAIDGKRVDAGRFGAILNDYKPGDVVRVSFFRRDELLERRLTLGERFRTRPKVVPVASPTAAQRALFERWLLVPFPTG
jgi:predicted metalloprotease with PDZ domain